MSTTKTDRAFKTLINKRTTDEDKRSFEEFGDNTINVSADELWVDGISSTPATAVSDGIATQETLFTLTEDTSVSNQQAYYAYSGGSRVKDWISDKYGSDYTVHLYDNDDNEIFPTDASDWFFDYQTGILTFSGDTSVHSKPYKISGYRYIGTKGLSKFYNTTEEDMTIQIDYEDATSVDPSGVVFYSQAVIDEYLSAAGATSFKHIQAVIDVLPPNIQHIVTLELSSGIHRPRTGEEDSTAWNIKRQKFAGGKIVIQGSTTYDVYSGLSGLTIQSINLNDDPYLVFSGTPFTGMDLKGYFAQTSDGLTICIHKNTDDTIYVCGRLSPAPTPGVSTVQVCSPSTVLRNSQTDLAGSGMYTWGLSTTDAVISFKDIKIDMWGASGCHHIRIEEYSKSYLYCYRIMIDVFTYYNTFGSHGGTVQSSIVVYDASVSFNTLAFLTPTGRTGAGDESSHYVLEISGMSVFFRDAYLAGAGFGIYISTDGLVNFTNTVIAEMGDSISGVSNRGIIQVYQDATVSFGHLYFWNNRGKINEIRDVYLSPASNESASAIGLRKPGARLSGSYTHVIAKNLEVNFVFVEEEAIIDGFYVQDGGGNTGDWGIYIFGPRSLVSIDTDSDITGTSGDIRLPNGDAMTYAELETLGIITDLSSEISGAPTGEHV